MQTRATTIKEISTVAALTALLLLSCSSKNSAPPVAPGPNHVSISAQPPRAPASVSPTQSTINVSQEIRQACGISEAEAKFAFDSSRVEKATHPVLQKIATCFTHGALTRRHMKLVGHADARGEHEYNLVLGGGRADSVKSFLVDLGVPGAHIATSSRGEMDAKGNNEASWAQDRRVDVLLAN
jgi:peptidoglycan-associated lipoprotein